MVSQRNIDGFNRLRDLFKNRQSFIFVEFSNMNAEVTSNLKSKVWSCEKIDFLVFKNNVMKKALSDTGFNLESCDVIIKSNMLMIYSDDIFDLSKMFFDFIKDYKDIFTIKFGIEKMKYLDLELLENYSKMPSLDNARSSLITLMSSATIYGLFNVVQKPVLGFYNICDHAKNDLEKK
ncbi:50S ribosomal protein L10 [Anaplasmataceae bacterium AB001_6]|nr:50S ribosomal protein L10 [Anaplasmataceae bacterium AB001_6]